MCRVVREVLGGLGDGSDEDEYDFLYGMDLGRVSKIYHWESTYHSFSVDWNWRFLCICGV